MELKQAEAIIESVLFAAGEPVDVEKLSDILDIDTKSTRAIVTALADKYDREMRGLRIIRLEDSYQMCTRREYSDYISKLVEPRRSLSLSNAAMEVLAIVAYKQPVTRAVIEQIRGVSCDTLVNKLLEKNFIEEVGRLDTPGRPMLFGTTDEFLRCFGIESVMELPEFDERSQDPLTRDEGIDFSQNGETDESAAVITEEGQENKLAEELV
ncbi:MAG: SMC-Scp complex subunit ScpB [Clostridia bacterium]|nr:SMC-Scp complex subunit ScpB [Clostridia bacterium]